ncbi:hypothetical protein ACFL43_00515 [Thermodesulfobacteriota bacterium]
MIFPTERTRPGHNGLWLYARIALLSVALVAVFVSGCAYHQSVYPRLPEITDPHRYLRDVLKAAPRLEQLSGFAYFNVTSPVQSFRSKNIFFFQRPENIRLEVLGFLNQTALVFLTDGKTLQLAVPSQNSCYSGPALDKDIAAITGMWLRPNEIIDFFSGHPLAHITDSAKISWSQDKKNYFFEITEAGSTQYLWLRPDDATIDKYTRFEDGLLTLEIRYGPYSSIGGSRVPLTVELNGYAWQTRLSATFDSLQVSSIEEKLFLISPPRGAVCQPLEKFFKNQ